MLAYRRTGSQSVKIDHKIGHHGENRQIGRKNLNSKWTSDEGEYLTQTTKSFGKALKELRLKNKMPPEIQK